jgi:hypothetical protein
VLADTLPQAPTRLPYVPELYHFHGKTPPEVLYRQGVEGVAVQLLVSPPDPARLVERLKRGDALLASRAAFDLFYGNRSSILGSFELRAIRWAPKPFSRESVEYLVLLLRKDAPAP